jgi:hypothetical protein
MAGTRNPFENLKLDQYCSRNTSNLVFNADIERDNWSVEVEVKTPTQETEIFHGV